MRSVNEEGRALIKNFEGFSREAYICPGQKWTIGYGHTQTARSGMRVSEEAAENLLAQDLANVALAIEENVTVPLTDHQFAALASFVFNVGVSAFARSTLLRLLNRGWYDQVPAQLMRWTRAGGKNLAGLARRRAAEAALWQKGT